MAEKTYRTVGDTIEGDMISVECRKYTKWQLFMMSGQHKGKDVRRYTSDDLYRAGWDDGFNVCKGSNEAMDRILLRR